MPADIITSISQFLEFPSIAALARSSSALNSLTSLKLKGQPSPALHRRLILDDPSSKHAFTALSTTQQAKLFERMQHLQRFSAQLHGLGAWNPQWVDHLVKAAGASLTCFGVYLQPSTNTSLPAASFTALLSSCPRLHWFTFTGFVSGGPTNLLPDWKSNSGALREFNAAYAMLSTRDARLLLHAHPHLECVYTGVQSLNDDTIPVGGCPALSSLTLDLPDGEFKLDWLSRLPALVDLDLFGGAEITPCSKPLRLDALQLLVLYSVTVDLSQLKLPLLHSLAVNMCEQSLREVAQIAPRLVEFRAMLTSQLVLELAEQSKRPALGKLERLSFTVLESLETVFAPLLVPLVAARPRLTVHLNERSVRKCLTSLTEHGTREEVSEFISKRFFSDLLNC